MIKAPCALDASVHMGKEIYQVLWKTKSLKHINILIWVMLHGSLKLVIHFTAQASDSLFISFYLSSLFG